MLFRTRDLPVCRRTQTINALRGHLAEFGIAAPLGLCRLMGGMLHGDVLALGSMQVRDAALELVDRGTGKRGAPFATITLKSAWRTPP